MLRTLCLIAASGCIVASVGCDGGSNTPNTPTPTVTVEFGGRVVNADAGGPVGNVRVSFSSASIPETTRGWVDPTNTATSGGDGTFTLALNLPMGWASVSLNLTAPPGHDDTSWTFAPTTAADRPTIRMYPTLVIGSGESIDVRVEGINVCGGGLGHQCRRVLVAASPGDPVEVELVSHDSSEPMALSLEDWRSVRRLMVPLGGVLYVIGFGTARLTARR